jgi:hypothetical protein
VAIIGEAGIEIDAITDDLRRSINRDLNAAFAGVRINADPLTDVTEKIRLKQLELARAGDEVLDSTNRVRQAETDLANTRREFGDNTEQTRLAEQQLTRARMEARVAQDRYNQVQRDGARIMAEHTGHTKTAGREHNTFRNILDAAGDSLRRFSNGLSIANPLLSTTIGLGTKLSVVTAAVGALGSLVGPVTTLTAGLVTASGAALLIPGALAGAVGVFAAVKLGGEGIERAFKNLDPVLNQLKENVSRSFEAALLPMVKNLQEILPKLTTEFKGLATAISGIGVQITNTFKTPENIKLLQALLRETTIILQNVGKSFAPLLEGFARIGIIGGQVIEPLTRNLGAAAQRFAEWTKSAEGTIRIREIIVNAIDAIRNLIGIVVDVGRVVGGVFKAMETASGGSLTAIRTLTSGVADFLNSVRGQEVLVSFFTALKTVVEAVLPALRTAATVLGTVVAPIIAQIAYTLGPPLQRLFESIGLALETARPSIQAFAYQFAIFLDRLAPQLPSLITGFFNLAEAAALILTALAPLVGPLGQIASAFADTLRPAIETIAPALQRIGAAVAQSLITALRDLAPILPGLTTSFIALTVPLVQGLVPVLPALVSALRILAAAFVILTPSIMIINSLIIAFVTLLTAGLQLLTGNVQHSMDTIRTGFQTAGASIKIATEGDWTQIAKNIINPTQGAVSNATERIGELPGPFSQAGQDARAGIADPFANIPGDVAQGVGGAYGNAQAGLSGFPAVFDQAGNNAFAELNDGMSRLGGTVAGGVGNAGREGGRLPGVLHGAMGDPGSFLREAGRGFIQGLIDGMKSKAAEMINTASGLLGNLRRIFPFSPAKEGPFAGRGYTLYSGQALIRDFGRGIDTGIGDLLATATAGMLNLRTVLAGSSLPTVGVGQVATTFAASGTGSSDRAVSAAVQVEITAQLTPLIVAIHELAGRPVEAHLVTSGRALARLTDRGNLLNGRT